MRCARCRVDKAVEDFGFRDKKRGKLRGTCKQCFARYHREHYIRHPEKQAARNIRHRALMVEWLNSHKTAPCLDCNRTCPTYVLDFDHRDGTTKRFNISKGIYNFSKKVILEEIAKCDLICANCHRVRTHERALLAAVAHR